MSADPLPPRVAAMVARFETIGREVMAELPVHNPALRVEAVGFRPFADGWLGVLVTPWFMNVILLPETPEPVEWSRIGRAVEIALPAGPRTFMEAGDEELGGYRMLSLHSPMDQFKHQPQARSEAVRRLLEVTTPPAEPAPAEPEAAARPTSRRGFLSAIGPG